MFACFKGCIIYTCTLRLLLIATTSFSVLKTITIPYNAQHKAARYGCCVFICQCGSCTPAAVNEVLSVKYEVYNPYAIALKKQLPGRISCSVVGHMQPKELSIVYFIVLHGASVAAKVIKRSPLGWRFLLKY